MSNKTGRICFHQPAAEKQTSRDRDQKRLDEGSVSPAELRQENFFFASLPLHNYKMVAIGGKPLDEKSEIMAKKIQKM